MFGAESGNGEPLRDTPSGARCIGRFEQPASRGDRVPRLRRVCVDGEFEGFVIDADERRSRARSVGEFDHGRMWLRGARRVTMLPG